MNLRHLRHFLAVADERHFGRAAKRLNMEQPPLSQSLMRLEASLGFRLFDRTRRSVKLTAAGEAFLVDVRPALARLDRAVRMAEKANAGVNDKLRIGYVSTAVVDILPRALAEARQLTPGIEFELQQMSTAEQCAQLLDGRLDLAFISSQFTSDPQMSCRIVARYHPMLAVPATMDLAGKPVIDIADLEGIPIIATPAEYASAVYAFLDARAQSLGFALNRVQEFTRAGTALDLVGAGIGVALTSEAHAARGYPGVTFRHVEGLPPDLTTDFWIAWLTGAPAKGRPQLLAALANELASEPATPRKAGTGEGTAKPGVAAA